MAVGDVLIIIAVHPLVHYHNGYPQDRKPCRVGQKRIELLARIQESSTANTRVSLFRNRGAEEGKEGREEVLAW